MNTHYPIAILAAAAIVFSCEKATSQSNGEVAAPCQANPDAASTDKTLAEQLDECNSVLTPPKVGDGEIVEPAPDTGTIIVVPPGALPEQQSEADRDPETKLATAESSQYDIGEIVDAISSSKDTAAKLRSVEPSQVNVLDISILLGGGNAAVLNTTLAEHSEDVMNLKSAIFANPTLYSAVVAKGLSIPGIVAGTIDGSVLTLYGR